jgi:PAS domain S-box-containing protein
MNKETKAQTGKAKEGALRITRPDDLSFLSRSAMAFIDFPLEGNLFSLIADLLSDLLSNDAILAVSDYDERAGLFRPRAIRGLETMLEATRKILGKDPMELAGDYGPAAKKALASGKFVEVEGGLSDFSNRILPGPVAKAIEKLLGISGLYVVGFVKAGKIIGGLSVVTRKQTTLPAPALFEAFAGQAAVALERRRVQVSLNETEATLRVFFNTLPGPALLISREGLILEVNEPMAKRLMRSRAEVIGQPAFNLIPPEIAKGRIDRFRTVLETGRPAIFEDSRAGVFYLNFMSPVLDEKNEVSKVAVFAMDITERKQAEESLRASNERLSVLFDAAPDGYYLCDMKGVFLDGNRAAEEITGFAKQELIGQDFLRTGLLSARDIPKAASLLARSILGKSTGPDEFVLNRKDGSKIRVEIRTHVVKILGQRVVLGIARDITERLQAEEELKQRERRLRGILDNAPFGAHLYELGPDGRLVFIGANRSADRILGVDNSQFIGKAIEEAFPALTASDIPEAYRRVAKTGEPFETERFAYNEQGISGVFEVHAFQFGPSRMAALFRDITERWRAEEALRKSEERLREAQTLGKIGNWEFDLTTGKIDWSDEVYVLYERDKALGPPTEEEDAGYYSPDQVKILREYGRLAIEKGQEFTFDLNALLPSGKTVFFNASMRP